MSEFFKEKKVEVFKRLGDFLLNPDEEFRNLIASAQNKNAWFTADAVSKAISANGEMLNEADLNTWLSNYSITNERSKKVGLILAGNIPMVGFHDILAVLILGNTALLKLSSQDDLLIPAVLHKLLEIEPEFKGRIQLISKLEGFDAVIATGSSNSSRYFDYYFSKVPNIIRKNRNSIALLTGEETTEELHLLGKDIFDYYGLGCRNVSKLLVPEDYAFNHFFESIESYHDILHHHKYHNNYDYNKSIYLVNRNEHLDNGFLLVSKNERLTSPLSTVHYQEYKNLKEAFAMIQDQKEHIQVVVTHVEKLDGVAKVGFGESQKPKLWDYADGVDTIQFLSALS